MKRLFILAALFCSASNLWAQSKTNEQAALEQKAAGHTGSFSYTMVDNKKVNVSYSFSPLVPKDKVDFYLHTPTPRPLSIKIINAAGKVVLTWKPEKEIYLQKGSLDVSSLKPGKYAYQIFWEDKSIQTIKFEKQ